MWELKRNSTGIRTNARVVCVAHFQLHLIVLHRNKPYWYVQSSCCSVLFSKATVQSQVTDMTEIAEIPSQVARRRATTQVPWAEKTNAGNPMQSSTLNVEDYKHLTLRVDLGLFWVARSREHFLPRPGSNRRKRLNFISLDWGDPPFFYGLNSAKSPRGGTPHFLASGRAFVCHPQVCHQGTEPPLNWCVSPPFKSNASPPEHATPWKHEWSKWLELCSKSLVLARHKIVVSLSPPWSIYPLSNVELPGCVDAPPMISSSP